MIYEDKGYRDTFKTVIEKNVSLPQRMFSGIEITIPDYYLTLCEVEVFLNAGKTKSCFRQ